MNHYIRIAKEVVGLTGHKELEYVSFLPYTAENLAMIDKMDVIRTFESPFDSSVMVVVVK